MRLAILAFASSIHTVRWANALCARGVEVHVISSHVRSEQMHSEVMYHKLSVRHPFGYFANAFALKRLLNKLKPDLLHAHFVSSYATLARLSGFHPTVVSVWGTDIYEFPDTSILHRSLVRQNLRFADAVCSTSEVMAQRTKNIAEFLEAIHITPFGIDTELFYPKPKEAKAKLIVGTVKALEPKYGIDTLIHAFAQALKSLPSSFDLPSLVIAGKGSQEADLKALVHSLNLDTQVEFLGQIEHARVPEVLNSFDIYAALSRDESFGVAVLEASSCALPVLVTQVGGLAEVVDNGITGICVALNDVEAVSEALVTLLQDEALRKRLGENGRKHVLAKYSWQTSVDAMQDVYYSVLES